MIMEVQVKITMGDILSATAHKMSYSLVKLTPRSKGTINNNSGDPATSSLYA